MGISLHLNTAIWNLSISVNEFFSTLSVFSFIFYKETYLGRRAHAEPPLNIEASPCQHDSTLWHAFQSLQLMEKTAESKTKLPKHGSVDEGKYHYVGSGCHVKTINNHNLKLPSAMNHSRSNGSCLLPLKISLDPKTNFEGPMEHTPFSVVMVETLSGPV